MPATVLLSPHFDDAVLSCWRGVPPPRARAPVEVLCGVPPPGPPARRRGPPKRAPDDALPGPPPGSLTRGANRLGREEFERRGAAVGEYASQIPALEAFFRPGVDAPGRLGYEVEGGGPPAASGSSSASAASRKPAAS